MAWRFSAPELSHGLWTGLWAALVAVVTIVIAETLTADETPAGYRILFRLVGTAYVACGLIAWRRRPDSHSGLLLTAPGSLLFPEPLLNRFGSLGDLTEDLWSITIVWLLLTMLSGGRLTSRVDETLVGLFVLEFAIEALRLATGGAEDGALAGVEGLVVSIGCLGTAVTIGVRYARASAPRRRALLPSVAGVGALLLFAFAQGGEPPVWLRGVGVMAPLPLCASARGGDPPMWFRWVAVLSLLAVPAGFLVGLLRSRLAPGGLGRPFRRPPPDRGGDLPTA